MNEIDIGEINSGVPFAQAALDAIENIQEPEEEEVIREKRPWLSDSTHRFLVGLGGFFILIIQAYMLLEAINLALGVEEEEEEEPPPPPPEEEEEDPAGGRLRLLRALLNI